MSVYEGAELPRGGSFGLPRSEWPKECVSKTCVRIVLVTIPMQILPTELDSLWMEWYKFWRERFPDRLIQFLPHMGTAEIKVTLDQSRFTVRKTHSAATYPQLLCSLLFLLR
jgi:hypothetical protein